MAIVFLQVLKKICCNDTGYNYTGYNNRKLS